MDRGAESKYPSWADGAPNLKTYLDALNKSQPIVQSQFELVWSRWPRTVFFAKGITIPGVSVNTLDLSHAGFTIKIPTHVTYETTDITLNIIADKEGFHYYDLRNMVMQTGHPLVAGDPKSTIGNPYGISPDEDTIEVRLRNKPDDETHHHWIIHNFKPTELGDLELSVDGSSFVEFELKGTFTHITYDCGKTLPAEEPPPRSEEEQTKNEDEDVGLPGDVQVDVEFEDEEEDEEEQEEEYEDDEDWYDEEAEFDNDTEEEHEDEFYDEFIDEYDDEDFTDDEWEDWNNEDWGYGEGEDPEFTLQGEDFSISTDGFEANGTSCTITGEPYADQGGDAPTIDEYHDAANAMANEQAKEADVLKQDLAKVAEQASSEAPTTTQTWTDGNTTTTVTSNMTQEQSLAAQETILESLKQQRDRAKSGRNTVLK